MRIFPTFAIANYQAATALLGQSYKVHSQHWQGMDISKRPEAAMHEVLNWDFQVPLRGIEMLMHWRDEIKPNIPWADDHFAERVGGKPLNPGEQWKNWPYALSADKFRTQGELFDHTYMERFWPKYAGMTPIGEAPVKAEGESYQEAVSAHKGVRFEYGDLNDLVDHLAKDPLSRQAYLPIWFPEDGTCSGRKPCTLGYWFILRNGFFHMFYPIRSCDITRHFRDDCYMAVRLLLWLLDQLRARDHATWGTVQPGMYSMWIGSFHCFVNDHIILRKWLEESSESPNPIR